MKLSLILISTYRSVAVVSGAFFRETGHNREFILRAAGGILTCSINLQFHIIQIKRRRKFIN